MVATLLPPTPLWLGVWALVVNYLSQLTGWFPTIKIFGRSTDAGKSRKVDWR